MKVLTFTRVNFENFVTLYQSTLSVSCYYFQVHNKWGGVKINGGGFKDFEKLINGGVKISGGGWAQNIKEKRRK